jgi:hypothetical protein
MTGGLFAGNVAVIHAALGDLIDSSNEAFAMSIFGAIWPIGAIIGHAYHRSSDPVSCTDMVIIDHSLEGPCQTQ